MTTHVLAAGSATEPPAFLAQLVALIVAAALIGYTCSRLRIVPIVGFLLAGVAIGPDALGLVRNLDVVNVAAEIGVILLLFSIGIEFSLERLARIKRLILAGGGLQVGLTTGILTGALALAGVSWQIGLYTGFLVALSSTAIVLKLLGDRGETSSTAGQVGLAFLIFQDLAVVGMVLVVPMLGSGGGSAGDIVAAFAKAVGIVLVVLVVARRVMPKLLEVVARTCSPELFLLTVIAICFGTAYLTSLAGVSVSLGAFLAGLVVSESRHSEHAFGEILPLQILFSATFFLSVGMLLDLGFVVRHLPLVLAAVGVVLAVKIVATAASALVLRTGAATGVSVALLLAQVGEFSFVLERVGRDAGLRPADLGGNGSQAFIASTVLLMVATPWLGSLGSALGGRLAARRRRVAAARMLATAPQESRGRRGHVILAGYGDAARSLAADLRGAGQPFVITTLNPDGAAEAEDAGHDVLRGDASKAHTLETAGIRAARMLVVADDGAEMTQRVAALARELNPDVTVVVRPLEETSLLTFAELGVDKLVSPERASQNALAKTVLAELHAEAPPIRPGRAFVDAARIVRFVVDPDSACPHVGVIEPVLPSAYGCEDCLRIGSDWVHLRICMTCGHVGCCESSPNRHASVHADEAGHPIIRSAEPGEDWGWCYLDSTMLRPAVPAPEGEPEPAGRAVAGAG